MISDSMRFCVLPRRGRPRNGVLAVVLVFATFLPSFLSGTLLGGRVYAMQLTPVQKQEMKTHYEKATRAYDVQKYGEAVDEYQKAYEIGGDPAMLYNVAQSFRLNDQIADSLRFYRRYLQRSPNARNREDVERKIADLEKVVEERRKLAAAASTPVAPPPVVTAPAPVSDTPTSQAASDGSTKLIVGIVLASVGGAALVTAAITGKLAADKGDLLTKASTNGSTFDPKWESTGKQLNTVTIVSGIVGGAAVVAGAVLIVLSQQQGETAKEQHAFISPLVGGGVMGAAAMVRF
jgi:hypothetical protein